ncbi:MAG: hypothetical protein LIP09_15275 [Bacteroidales bacterium]|nr:hypothetical protein [Bacteroidales bacterium]
MSITSALNEIRAANIEARRILLQEIKNNPPLGLEGLVVNSRCGIPAAKATMFRELFFWIHFSEKDNPEIVYWINLFGEILDTQSGNLHTVPNHIQFWKNVKYQNHRFGINHFTEDKRWIMANPKDSKLSSYKVDDLITKPSLAHKILMEFSEFVKNRDLVK